MTFEDGKELHDNIQKQILDKMKKLDYPKEHPFLQNLNTRAAGLMEILILLKLVVAKDEIFDDLLKKCRSVEKGQFNVTRFLQNIHEVLVMYYMLIGDMENLESMFYEPTGFYDNGKKLEFSIKRKGNPWLINCEVKTLTCDPFFKEGGIAVKDGTVLLKPFLNDYAEFEEICAKYPGAIRLQHSTYYTQLKNNILKIVDKYNGNSNVHIPMVNLGIICIPFSTSMEEFYAYLFHKEKGIFYSTEWGNLDALILLTLDARNDIMLKNVYDMGYVKSIALHDAPEVHDTLKVFRMDQYLSIGGEVVPDVLELGQKTYGVFKVLARDGFLTIVPVDSTEQQIENYVNYLKGEWIRYDAVE